MTNQLSESFPATRQDINALKKTAVEATQDLVGTAGVHASKAKDQIKNLASHAQEEGRAEVDRARVRLADLGNTFCEFISERPLTAVGTALAIGFLFGVSRARLSNS
ncbi:MAG: hypothetical protein LV479_01550 [Methylacidiphilales bacterium]|nr:hypothetical protein [Candidatus Methylacidiphilales bacterium]